VQIYFEWRVTERRKSLATPSLTHDGKRGKLEAHPEVCNCETSLRVANLTLNLCHNGAFSLPLEVSHLSYLSNP
jgi:hypothetical protein